MRDGSAAWRHPAEPKDQKESRLVEVITPKKTFATSRAGKEWDSIVNSSQFEAAATAALAQMQLEMGQGGDVASSAAGHWQMQGAKLFLSQLMNLCSPEIPSSAPRSANLSRNT